MVKPSSGFNAPETDAVYPLGHLIGNFEINQGLLNFKHQVDILICCALFDIVLIQPLNDELFIYFLTNVALVQNDLILLFGMCLLAPQFAVVSPYYESSLVIGNGAASIAATNGGSGGRSPPGYDRYF